MEELRVKRETKMVLWVDIIKWTVIKPWESCLRRQTTKQPVTRLIKLFPISTKPNPNI